MCLFSVYSGADENFYTILHTTELGALRVKRNLNLETDDVVAWCRAVLAMDNLYLGNVDGLWTNTAATFRNSKDPYVKKAIYNQLSSFINVYLVSLQKNIAKILQTDRPNALQKLVAGKIVSGRNAR